jgi:NhaP-type Na+/H+ or K+/H+ antiporter
MSWAHGLSFALQLSTVYFWIFHGVQTPLVEVLMFFCFALLPYYICDGIEWSGIVCTVATGFVMDLHIVGQRSEDSTDADPSETEVLVDRTAPKPARSFTSRRERRPIFNCTNGQLSEESRAHIGFVAEIIATTMETAIFAYLGLFLFSHRYHWNIWHTLIAIAACGLSRAMMIPTMSFFANWVTRIQGGLANGCRLTSAANNKEIPSPPGVMVDKKMQMVLWFAGLRGAMSFALVEHIPMYDASSGEGTPLKPELKAMTSASILFTVFVLGGYTFYVMEHLGMSPSNARKTMNLPTSDFLPVSSRGRDRHTSETASSSRPSSSSFDDDENDATISMRARRRQGTTTTTRTSRSPMRVELNSRPTTKKPQHV